MALVYSTNEGCAKPECTEAELKKKPKDKRELLNDCDDVDIEESVDYNDYIVDEDAIDEPVVIDETSNNVKDFLLSAGITAALVAGPAIVLAVKNITETKTAIAAIKEYENAHPDLIPIDKMERKKHDLKNSYGDVDIDSPSHNQKFNRAGTPWDDTGYVWYYDKKPFMALSIVYGNNMRKITFIPLNDIANKYSGYYGDMTLADISKKRKKVDWLTAGSWTKTLVNKYKKDRKQSHKNESAIDIITESAFEYSAKDRVAIAQALVESAIGEVEFTKLLQEGVDELCLDEGYIKNQLTAHAITSGAKMREAKKCQKDAKRAVKSMNYKAAVGYQRRYVQILKELADECNSIEDDTKMILITSAVIKGLISSLASAVVGALTWTAAPKIKKMIKNPKAFDQEIAASQKGLKKVFSKSTNLRSNEQLEIDAEAAAKAGYDKGYREGLDIGLNKKGMSQEEAEIFAKKVAEATAKLERQKVHTAEAHARSEEQQKKVDAIDGKQTLEDLKNYEKTIGGKVHIGAIIVTSAIIGILEGKKKYSRDMLRYTGGIQRMDNWKVPISRVDAQQKLRRMVRLAEDVLKDYEGIARVEITHF